MQMTPDQCRMARAALRWSVAVLAEKADVRAATVSSFEAGNNAYRSTIDALQKALEDGGAIFVSAGEASLTGGAGVRLRSDPE